MLYNSLYNIRGILIPHKDEPKYVKGYEKLYVIGRGRGIFSIRTQKWLTPTYPLIKINRKTLIKEFGENSQKLWEAAFVNPEDEVLTAKKDIVKVLTDYINKLPVEERYKPSVFNKTYYLLKNYQRGPSVTLSKNGVKRKYLVLRLIRETYPLDFKEKKTVGLARKEYFKQYMRDYRKRKKRLSLNNKN